VVLTGISKGSPVEEPQKEASELPDAKVKAPDAALLAKIRAMGVVVSPLTHDNRFISLNMVNAPAFSDADMALLTKLSSNVIWLDMSETAITDQAMPFLKNYIHLTRLSLDQTKVSDKGLVHLQSLPRLKYLNLYGTKVTDQGLKQVANCKNLKSIYLWQTQVTPQGVAALQQRVGKEVEINFGIDTL
jgi:hypothetical protein